MKTGEGIAFWNFAPIGSHVNENEKKKSWKLCESENVEKGKKNVWRYGG